MRTYLYFFFLSLLSFFFGFLIFGALWSLPLFLYYQIFGYPPSVMVMMGMPSFEEARAQIIKDVIVAQFLPAMIVSLLSLFGLDYWKKARGWVGIINELTRLLIVYLFIGFVIYGFIFYLVYHEIVV